MMSNKTIYPYPNIKLKSQWMDNKSDGERLMEYVGLDGISGMRFNGISRGKGNERGGVTWVGIDDFVNDMVEVKFLNVSPCCKTPMFDYFRECPLCGEHVDATVKRSAHCVEDQ